MSYEERNIWVSGVVSVLAYTAYVVVVLNRARDVPLTEVAYVAPLLWSIGGAIVVSILASIGVGLANRRDGHMTDQRDKEINRLGERTGQSFVVIGALSAMVLALVEADWFWIANVDLPLLRPLRDPLLRHQARRLPTGLLHVVKPTQVTNTIRTLRFTHGEMTQADLAQRIGVTRQTVIAIEQGRYSPSLEMAFQIARVFDVPLDDVFQYPG